ncbi:MAG: PD-(D/E)XK nuclease family protein, partial [Planctomycetaceae bacterium]|nr:PD-(D/E)XK nuclease family protein [Planctomycetaceae bacterium]
PLGQFMPSVLDAVAETLPPSLDTELIRRSSRRQVSISELENLVAVEQFFGNEVETEPEPISAEELGTLVHTVLERLDYSRPETLPQVLETIWSSSRKRLSAEQQSLARRLIEPFLNTAAAQTIAVARRSFREIDFLLRGNLLNPAVGELLISGTIDQLLETEDGRWIVADFKTGRRLADDPEKLRSEYELQMGIYALAVEQVLGHLPDEVWLIHLRQSDPVVKYRIDDALLARVRESSHKALSLLDSVPQKL